MKAVFFFREESNVVLVAKISVSHKPQEQYGDVRGGWHLSPRPRLER